MGLNLDKYTTQSHEEAVKQEEKVQEFSNSNFKKRNWVSVKEGINVIRFFPAHLDSGSRVFAYAKVTSQLEVMVSKKDKDGQQTQELKNRNIFNSRSHGGTEKDLIEEYIDFVTKMIEENIQDKDDRVKKLAPITNWKTGMTPKTSWVSIVKMINPDGKEEIGYWDFTNGIKSQMNSMGARREAGKPIQKDLFSHPITGKAIQLDVDSKRSSKDKYKAAIIFEEDFPLTEEEITYMEEKLDSLESMFVDTFKKKDFELQLEGLQRFDEKHDYRAFDHSNFIDIVEEIQAYYQDEDEEKKDESQEENHGENDSGLMYENELEALNTLSKEELIAFIKVNKLPLDPRTIHTQSRIFDDIVNHLDQTSKMSLLKSMLDKAVAVEEKESTQEKEEEPEESSSTISKFKNKYKK